MTDYVTHCDRLCFNIIIRHKTNTLMYSNLLIFKSLQSFTLKLSCFYLKYSCILLRNTRLPTRDYEYSAKYPNFYKITKRANITAKIIKKIFQGRNRPASHKSPAPPAPFCKANNLIFRKLACIKRTF